VVTALPTGAYDPDARGEERYPFTLIVRDDAAAVADVAAHRGRLSAPDPR
jgi:hypothetical protein